MEVQKLQVTTAPSIDVLQGDEPPAAADVPAEADAGEAAYREAMGFYAQHILRMHFGEKLVNKIFGRATQSHAAGLLAIMHFRALEGRGRRPTLAAIQAQMGSPRTLSAFFALLRVVGFVRSETAEEDTRSRYLVPTPLLLEGLRAWIAHHLRCCEILGLSPVGAAERVAADDAFFAALIARMGPVFERARAGAGSDNGFTWFDGFDCGDRIALVLLRSHYAAAPDAPESVWLGFSSRTLAEGLGISRSHVRNVINQAAARSLIMQDRAGHRVCLAPRFLDDSRAWFVGLWQLMAAASSEAEAFLLESGTAPA